MGFISQLKCAFNSKQSLDSYYSKLSEEQLEQRKKSLFKSYLAVTLAWALALIITIISGSMSFPLLILYTGVILVLFISTYLDYQSRKNKIDKILDGRRKG